MIRAEKEAAGRVMSTSEPTSSAPAHSYAAIENALMGNPRGRAFLADFARRNRAADTLVLLDAIAKLQAAVAPPAITTPSETVRRDLIEMSEAIAQTRREIAAIVSPNAPDNGIAAATGQLEAIVEATEQATGDILGLAESLQELSVELRSKGLKSSYCERFESLATDIFTACSFQDITGQRTTKVVKTLQFLECRVNAMIGIWGVEEVAFRDVETPLAESGPAEPNLLNGPQNEDSALKQDAIDSMLMNDSAQSDEILFREVAATQDLAFAEKPTEDEVRFEESAVRAASPAHGNGSASGTRPLPGVVDEDLFGQPEDLSLWSLDLVKRTALFG